MNNLDGINPNNNHLGAYTPRKRMGKLKKFVVFVVVLAVLGTIGWAAAHYISTVNKIFTNKKSIFTRVGGLFISSDKPLQGEDSGTVNVLLLGIGGEGHDGAYLTDTMIVASINTKTNEVVLTSIPRDWLVTIPGHGLNKINAVYAYGLQDHPGDFDAAGQAAIAAAEKVTGFTIPYYAQVDFKGFVTAVDHVGGVDITVDRTFSDSTFPNDFPFDTKGYLGTVTFNKGPQHMDGRTALIFARSRHGTNDEGSDFARSERQKKVIVAMKEKLLGLNITDINTLNKLLSDFTSNFRTNLEPYELLRLAKIAKNISGENIYSLSLEPQGDLICDTTIDQLTGRPYIHPVETETAPPTGTSTTTPPPSSTNKATNSNTGANTSKTTQPTAGKSTVPTTGGTAMTKTNTTSNSTSASGNNSTAPTTTQTPPQTPTQIPMYIVEPCPGKTDSDIHTFLANYWDTARLKKEAATIEIQNSTGKTIAQTSFRTLNLDGVAISYAPFPGKVAFDRSIIYDNTKGTKPRTFEYLQNNFLLAPADVQYTNSKADFVIVIGNDALK